VPCNDIVPVAWFVCHCSVEPEPDAVTLVPTRDAQKLRNAMGFEMCIDLTKGLIRLIAESNDA
jgi:hypothetical protein